MSTFRSRKEEEKNNYLKIIACASQGRGHIKGCGNTDYLFKK
jgi:hypothetical protein